MNDLQLSIHQALNNAGPQFEELNQKSGGYLDYMSEVNYVYQMVLNSINQQVGIAFTPIHSIIEAFFDIARTGLSVSPKGQLGFMTVVLDEASNSFICRFEIGYRGFLELASRSKGIKVITADVVYENDQFIFNGSRDKVNHRTKTLSTSMRGAFAGGYCTSELIDGSFVTTVMPPEEILAIEQVCRVNELSAWNSPFVDELRRKTLIRRHWKTLSMVAKSSFADDLVNNVERINEQSERSSTQITNQQQ